ncbi:hypothetical protein [Nonomuraea glycinis]|uniref:hypothetical protein n=1 Tax=Nonomuraea glycinis TaxID=2047744 RepID=UPI0033ABFA9B
MLIADPLRHALEIGRRVADTEIRSEALFRLRRDTTKPLTNKLGVNDRAAAVTEAFNRGLLIPRTPGQP